MFHILTYIKGCWAWPNLVTYIVVESSELRLCGLGLLLARAVCKNNSSTEQKQITKGKSRRNTFKFIIIYFKFIISHGVNTNFN